MDSPTWKNTFNSQQIGGYWFGSYAEARDVAKKYGYPYYSWNGIVYLSNELGMVPVDRKAVIRMTTDELGE